MASEAFKPKDIDDALQSAKQVSGPKLPLDTIKEVNEEKKKPSMAKLMELFHSTDLYL
jgi:hypothetical protein